MEPCNASKVLIVDDESGIRTLFRQMLNLDMPDLEIDLAENGEVGLELFRANHHKIVMMDLSMPIMDGETAFFEIMKTCRMSDWEEPAVIFCTGYAPSNSVEDALEYSDKHTLLSKPVGRDKIVEAVKARL